MATSDYDELAHRLFRQRLAISETMVEARRIGANKTTIRLQAIERLTTKMLNAVLTKIETLQISAAIEMAESPPAPPAVKVDLTKYPKEKHDD